jgi:hypothetical protein
MREPTTVTTSARCPACESTRLRPREEPLERLCGAADCLACGLAFFLTGRSPEGPATSC